MFEGPCTYSSPKLLPHSMQHICTLHCCTPGEIWEQESRPNNNTSGITVYRDGRNSGRVWKRLEIRSTPNKAYPDLVNAPTLLAVPASLKGLRDRKAAQEAMKFRDPKSIQEAVVAVSHIQGALVTGECPLLERSHSRIGL